MDGGADTQFPSALDLVQRSLDTLSRKRRAEGLGPVEEVRYGNLREIQDTLLGREAS